MVSGSKGETRPTMNEQIDPSLVGPNGQNVEKVSGTAPGIPNAIANSSQPYSLATVLRAATAIGRPEGPFDEAFRVGTSVGSITLAQIEDHLSSENKLPDKDVALVLAR